MGKLKELESSDKVLVVTRLTVGQTAFALTDAPTLLAFQQAWVYRNGAKLVFIMVYLFVIKKKLNAYLLVICVLATIFVTNAQQVTVINHKGTKIDVTSNSVITATTAPTAPAPVEGDFWFNNTDPGNVVANIWDGTAWILLANVSVITQTVTTGHKIASHNGGDGTTTSILETITTLSQDDTSTAANPAAKGEITYTDENGDAHKAQVVSADANNSLTVGADGGAYHRIQHAEFRPTANFQVNNSTILGVRDFFGASISNDGAVTRTSNSRLTINEPGYYQINFSSSLAGASGFRTNPEAILFINGAATRVRASSSYIRNAGGQNESSWNFSFMGEFNTGDFIEIRVRLIAAAGIVSALACCTTFTITKIGR